MSAKTERKPTCPSPMPFCEATSVSSATSHRTAASFHAAAFDPCGLLLWCAVPECSSQCSKLTERWKEAKGVHCNHLHSSIPHPRGPCKVTVFLSSPVLPLLAWQSHRRLFPQAGPMYKREVGEGRPLCILRSSLSHPFSTSRFIISCVFQVPRWRGWETRFVCFLVCLFAPDFSGQSCAATSQSHNALTAAAVKSCDMFSALHCNCCCMCRSLLCLFFVVS